MDGFQVGVQHSCKNSLSPWLPPVLWHKEAMEGLKEVRAKEKLLLNGESKTKGFYCMKAHHQTAFFFSLKLGGIGIM